MQNITQHLFQETCKTIQGERPNLINLHYFLRVFEFCILKMMKNTTTNVINQRAIDCMLHVKLYFRINYVPRNGVKILTLK